MTVNLPFKMYFCPDIMHFKVNNDHKSAIINFIEVNFFQGIFLLETAHFIL